MTIYALLCKYVVPKLKFTSGLFFSTLIIFKYILIAETKSPF